MLLNRSDILIELSWWFHVSSIGLKWPERGQVGSYTPPRSFTVENRLITSVRFSFAFFGGFEHNGDIKLVGTVHEIAWVLVFVPQSSGDLLHQTAVSRSHGSHLQQAGISIA